MEQIGAWAITEPGSGSDAFGGMKATARRDGDGYVLNGNKTFITNGPYADTIVFICKLDDGSTAAKGSQSVAELPIVRERQHQAWCKSKPAAQDGHALVADRRAVPRRRAGRRRPSARRNRANARPLRRQGTPLRWIAPRRRRRDGGSGIVEHACSCAPRRPQSHRLRAPTSASSSSSSRSWRRWRLRAWNIQNIVFRRSRWRSWANR
jgi:hypothetical protein